MKHGANDAGTAPYRDIWSEISSGTLRPTNTSVRLATYANLLPGCLSSDSNVPVMGDHGAAEYQTGGWMDPLRMRSSPAAHQLNADRAGNTSRRIGISEWNWIRDLGLGSGDRDLGRAVDSDHRDKDDENRGNDDSSDDSDDGIYPDSRSSLP